MAKRKMSTFERLNAGGMNRSQRRELGRRVAAGDPDRRIVHADAGGIDVGNESHFVAVPPDRDANPVREFGCWTESLNRMAEWRAGWTRWRCRRRGCTGSLCTTFSNSTASG